jgi:hypothetical protein
MWSGQPKQPWRAELSDELERRIDTAFDVAQERRPPGLVGLPICFTPDQAAKGENTP